MRENFRKMRKNCPPEVETLPTPWPHLLRLLQLSKSAIKTIVLVPHIELRISYISLKVFAPCVVGHWRGEPRTDSNIN